jgi:NNP family nitrate/nitrite transporter-like MFS transporter
MTEKKNSYRFVILGVACVVMFSPNYTQYQLAPLASQLITSFNLSPSQFAGIFSSPMIPGMLLSLIAGLLVDKFGIKAIITIALCITTAGTGLRLWANSYSLLFTSMVMSGLAGAFLNANSVKLIGAWFPPQEISGKMGILLGVQTIAMTIAMATTALLPGVRIAFTTALIISGLALLLWVIFIKTPKQQVIGNQEGPVAPPMLTCLKTVVKSRNIWLIGFCLFFVLGCNVLQSSFLPIALGERGIDTAGAGLYSSVVTIGYLIGCLFSPVIASKIGKNKPVMIVCALVSAAFTAFGWLAPQGVLLAIALFVAGVTLSGLLPLLMSMPIQLPEIGPVYAGTAGGFTGTIQLLGAVVLPAYIIAPITGNNMYMLFGLGGISLVLACLIIFVLPELNQGKKSTA